MEREPATVHGPALPRVAWRCGGCGYRVEPGAAVPFRCPGARPGDDVDHVLGRALEPAGEAERAAARVLFARAEPNPFLRYRELLGSWQRARAGGVGDGEYVALVSELDRRVATVDGRPFRATPFTPAARLAERLGVGELWIKDETGNVSGSHKARHLAGLMLWLEVERRLAGPADEEPPLAIASCGNAALAAAVVARAARRRLEVFIPPDANPRVVARLAELGAALHTCPRVSGEVGDPCFLRFREAVGGDALPFTCQGPENALVIEGGQTLAWEMVSTLLAQGATLDRIFVQVGGGALASAVALGLTEAVALGLLPAMPRLHAVQTRGAWPVVRAWMRVTTRLLRLADAGGADPPAPGEAEERSRRIVAEVSREAVEEELSYAARHRSLYMWPWESEPRSLATGILDDETYDWLAVVRAMLVSGGHPVVASEQSLAAARSMGHDGAGVDADATGAAGLAGLLELVRGGRRLPGERVAVLLTGARRG